MADLSPCALALIAVSEDNRRLRADVAARDAALDACAKRIAYVLGRRDALLVTVRNLSQSTPLPSELEGWEGQRAALVAEVGTLRAARSEALATAEDFNRQRVALGRINDSLRGCIDRLRGDILTASYDHGKAIAAVEQELRTAERQVLTLTEQLAVAQDDARADREALARYRARDATRGDIQ